MSNLVKKSFKWAIGIVSIVFMFAPEELFDWGILKFIEQMLYVGSRGLVIIVSRIISLCGIWLVVLWLFWRRKSVRLEGDDYLIKVEYGDIFKTHKCKKVISFDECYSTKVGEAPGDIKPTSICGEYLKLNPDLDIQRLIQQTNLKSESRKSKYQHKDRYKSGTILANGDDLLLAFVPLDEDGRGVFSSVWDYEQCLFNMWNEIDKYYGQHDVCIPILGAGITRIGDGTNGHLSQQKLLDLIIWSYKMSPHKIKKPYCLRIICKRAENFSLNDIDSK